MGLLLLLMAGEVLKIIRNHAETFSEERFKKEIKEFVELKYNEFNHLVK